MHRIAKVLNKAREPGAFSILGPRTKSENVTRQSFRQAGDLVYVRAYARRRARRVKVTRKRRSTAI